MVEDENFSYDDFLMMLDLDDMQDIENMKKYLVWCNDRYHYYMTQGDPEKADLFLSMSGTIKFTIQACLDDIVERSERKGVTLPKFVLIQ